MVETGTKNGRSTRTAHENDGNKKELDMFNTGIRHSRRPGRTLTEQFFERNRNTYPR
jgi:hypothetical protein